MNDPIRASITQEALAVADTEAAQWMRSVTGRRRAVPEHEVPNMVRSIIVAYLTHVALHSLARKAIDAAKEKQK
jgi:hypothetical protein